MFSLQPLLPSISHSHLHSQCLCWLHQDVNSSLQSSSCLYMWHVIVVYIIYIYITYTEEMFNLLVWGLVRLTPIKYYICQKVASIQQYNPTVVSHLIYIVCVLYQAFSTVLVSDVKLVYQTMLAISTKSVTS